jgi:hypothetical protein
MLGDVRRKKNRQTAAAAATNAPSQRKWTIVQPATCHRFESSSVLGANMAIFLKEIWHSCCPQMSQIFVDVI